MGWDDEMNDERWTHGRHIAKLHRKQRSHCFKAHHAWTFSPRFFIVLRRMAWPYESYDAARVAWAVIRALIPQAPAFCQQKKLGLSCVSGLMCRLCRLESDMTNNVFGDVSNVQKPMDQPMLQNPNRTQKPLPYILHSCCSWQRKLSSSWQAYCHGNHETLRGLTLPFWTGRQIFTHLHAAKPNSVHMIAYPVSSQLIFRNNILQSKSLIEVRIGKKSHALFITLVAVQPPHSNVTVTFVWRFSNSQFAPKKATYN